MSTIRIDERIGDAWGLHREGKNQQAIEAFKDVLNTAPTSVDAHYGLGLAQQADGQNEQALETFQKALELSTEAYQSSRNLAGAEGVPGENDLESIEDDRYMMLQRLIKQRITALGGNPDE